MKPSEKNYRIVFKIIYLQLGILLSVAVLWFFLKNTQTCYSALLGGLAWLLPSWFFIRKFFKRAETRSLQEITKDFFLSELIKFLLATALIILFLKIFPVNLVAFLSGFIGVVVASLLLPLFIIT